MTKMKSVYLGDLRVESTHLLSGTRLMTDAPVDNAGKGASFSPTDLCAVALSNCILTTMGIFAAQKGIDIQGAEAEVEKIMSAEPPRRIAEIRVRVQMPPKGYTDKEKLTLERTARTCAVHNTLHEALKIDLEIRW
ncbi:MAG: OsmC family protein [Bacteroidales bacterium]|nr:OsmC family protein [Bacteroidales bacterium]MDE7090384.1 OsmC family protein [Bacteroidales bacterium]